MLLALTKLIKEFRKKLRSQYSDHLNWLNGLRGLFSFIVFMSHMIQCWLLGYFPTNVQTYLISDPFYFLIDGDFAVISFFIISGISLSYKFFLYENFENLQNIAIFRYFRLSIPIFFSSLIIYILTFLGLDYKNFPPWATQEIHLSITEVFTQSFYHIFFNYNHLKSYNPVLWSIEVEFKFSMLIFSFLALFGKSKFRYFIYIFSFFLSFNTYLEAFLSGVILCDFYVHFNNTLGNKKIYHKTNNILSILLLIIFSILYKKYKLVKFMLSGQEVFTYLNTLIPAIILILSLSINDFLKKIFSSQIFQFMGRISFSLYLLHGAVLVIYSSFLYKKLSENNITIFYKLFFVISTTIFIVIFISYIFSIIIEEKLLNKLKKYIYNQ